DLERQLAEGCAAGDPGTNQGSPPAWNPPPAAFNAGQQASFPPPPQAGFPPPPVDWQNPSHQAPPNYWLAQESAGSTIRQRALICLVVGIPILILVIVGIGVAIVFNPAKPLTSTAPTQTQPASGHSTNTMSPTGSSSAAGPSPSSAAGPSPSSAAGPS